MQESQRFFDITSLEASRSELQARSESLRREIAERNGELAAVEERLTLTTRLIALERGGELGEVEVESLAPVALKWERSIEPNQAEDYIESEVEDILEVTGKPLHISDIREQLMARGVQIPGRGDDANIIVRLRKGDRFVRTARGTYGLPKWGIPSIDRQKARKGGSSR